MMNVKNRSKNFILAISIQLCALSSSAQNISINVDGSAPDPSAMLHVVSTDKGMLIPKMTEVQKNAIVNPATSLIIFQLDAVVGFYFNAGTSGTPSWIRLTTENDGISSSSIADTDNDTKIQVEEAANEDIIRFDIGGIELMRLDMNTLHLYDGSSNIFVGLNSGLLNTTGVENAGFGIDALRLNIAGNTNTAVGYVTLKNNTGSLNTAVGGFALTNNVGGNFNTALGRNALRDNVGGSNNVGAGQAAGVQMMSGDNNVFIGSASAENKTGGGNNTLIGTSSGFNNGAGTGNIFLGFQSGFNEAGSDKLYIENSNSVTPLIYGDFAVDSLVINGDFTVDPARNGTGYTFPAARGTNGQFLTTDASGNLSWGAVTPTIGEGGIYEGNGSITGNTTVALGGSTFQFTSSRIKGFEVDGNTFSINTVANRVGMGTDSPDSLLDVAGGARIQRLNINSVYTFPDNDGTNGDVMITNGSGAVSWGAITGTTGSGTADFLPKWIGSNTIGNSTIQDDGSSVSINASPSSFERFVVKTDGTVFFRAISGEQTENTPSTTVGVFGRSNSSDKSNSAGVFGYASNGAFAVYGQQGSSLAGVVAVNGLNSSGGSNANYGVRGQTTSSNTNAAGVYGFSFHGGNAVLAESNGRVIKALAYGARTTSFNAIELSNTATSTTGSIDKIGLNIQSAGAWIGASAINTGLNVAVSGGTTNYAALFNGGNVGIGETAPAYKLEVGGDINAAGVVRASGIALISDKRFKTNIVSLKKVLPLLMELEGVYHRWDSTSFPDKNFPNQREIGLIAQDLQKVYPELVHEDKQGYLSVDYAKFSAVLLQAVKEQQVQIEKLKADQFDQELQKIENKKLEARLELIEKMLLKK
jgi:hypothetical protein